MEINVVAKKLKDEIFDKDELFARIRTNVEAARQVHEEQIEIMAENAHYYAGDQWTEIEKQKHLEQNRIPYVFNEIGKLVDHLVGLQIQTRTESRVLARERSDEPLADMLSACVKWFEQVNNFKKIETEIFLIGVVKGVAYASLKWVNEDVLFGYPKIEIVPPEQMFVDPNSMEMNMSDARFVSRIQVVPKIVLIENFPEYENEIMEASEGSSFFNLSNFDVLYRNYLDSAGEAQEYVSFLEYFEKIRVQSYIVVDEVNSTFNITKFEKRKDAEDYMQGLIDQYTLDKRTITDESGDSLINIFEQVETKVLKADVIGDKLVNYEITDLPEYPFSRFACYWLDGRYWGVVDTLKYPQLFINRMISQVDFQIGTGIKSLVKVMPDLLYKGYTLKKFVRDYNKTASVIPVQNMAAFEPVPQQTVNPEYFQMIGWAEKKVLELMGGPNALGLQQNAAESGRAVLARAEMGGLARLPIFERLREWKTDITQKALWFIRNVMTPGQIIRIIGEDMDAQYIEMTPEVLSSLKNIQYDLVVEEAMQSDTMKERYFQIMKETIMAMPDLPAEIRLPILVEYSPLPASKKRQILKMFEMYQQYMQEAVKERTKMKEKDKVQRSLYRKALSALARQMPELQILNQGRQRQPKDMRETDVPRIGPNERMDALGIDLGGTNE